METLSRENGETNQKQNKRAKCCMYAKKRFPDMELLCDCDVHIHIPTLELNDRHYGIVIAF
jgi:hypothetical protein